MQIGLQTYLGKNHGLQTVVFSFAQIHITNIIIKKTIDQPNIIGLCRIKNTFKVEKSIVLK